MIYVWEFVVLVVLHPIFALVFGTLLAVVVPYVRVLLQRVAETGSVRDLGMPFDWRYLAMFLTPLLELGVLLLTTQGLWGVATAWTWTYAAMLGYSGSDLAKELTKATRAVGRVIARRPST